ncbi:MAG: hypothetical protein ABSD42_13840 [Candidatus Bathyarchaeia archaeon]
MTNLYKIGSSSNIEEIPEHQFSNETNDFESFIMQNQSLLGKVALINHQITIPNGKRIDAWGVDVVDLNPIIVELKNVKTGVDVISQILPYYNFVKTNPDTLKYQATQDKEFLKKLSNLGYSIQKLEMGLEKEPKVLIVAPSFDNELLDLINFLTFDVELVEISRFKLVSGEYLVTVDKPSTMGTQQSKVRVMEDWDWNKYETIGHASHSKVEIAKDIKRQIDAIIEKERLNLTPIFRKLYIPYQFGRNNILWIDINYTSLETGGVVVWFYIENEPNLKKEGIEIEHSSEKWFKDYNQFGITFDRIVDLSPLTSLIKGSYAYMTGTKV